MAKRTPHPLDAIETLYQGPKPGGFVHVMNVGSVEGGRVRIGEVATLRRATAKEARAIRLLHEWYGVFPPDGSVRSTALVFDGISRSGVRSTWPRRTVSSDTRSFSQTPSGT